MALVLCPPLTDLMTPGRPGGTAREGPALESIELLRLWVVSQPHYQCCTPISFGRGVSKVYPCIRVAYISVSTSAGQECPSLSGMCLACSPTAGLTHFFVGIPMGLGAGFKLIDKDKDKDKDRDKDNQKARARDDENEKPRSKHREREKDDIPKSRKNPEEPHDTPSGWTSMIEDWLCHGGGAGLRTSSPTVADVGFPKPLSPRIPSKEPRKGPYQLLVKERMMGIYLAVYIHREIRPLVRGIHDS